MKHTQDGIGKTLDRLLGRYDNPSLDRMQSAIDRVGESLRSGVDDVSVAVLSDGDSIKRIRRFPKRSMVAAASAIALVLGMVAAGTHIWDWRDNGAHAIVETIDGSLYRDSHTIGIGDRVSANEILRTNDGAGAQLRLADGSRVEMRARSELALERAEDGVRIRLSKGGVIVNAAKQHAGHLYVQTKDVTVSVVGTVFFVNAEDAGSRVAVIQGEVHVQEGASSKKLLPGEQVATNSLMELHPVSEEISWSRSAPVHLAMLQQSAAPKTSPRPEFEVVSLKQAPRPSSDYVRCKGIDGAVAGPPDLFMGGYVLGVSQGRCAGDSVSPVTLIAFAYGIPAERVSGGPDPDRSDIYQIEAKAGAPSMATKEQLRQMLQTVLADRFALKVHRETKEAPGYVLRVGKNGSKLREISGDEEFLPPAIDAAGQVIFAGKVRLKTFVESLGLFDNFLSVIDKTDLLGVYDLSLTLRFVSSHGGAGGERSAQGAPPDSLLDPPLSKALEDQLGLRLESARVPVEYLVVDHIEKPSLN